ncbi:hypothetical protein TNCV_269901 [Trichonephila clavipes]|nr:hypothetical protein TNCV_269901 [Trichonephila clavipes]
MDEQLKALLEGINALKSGQEDMQKGLKREWRICREDKKRLGKANKKYRKRMEDLEKKLLAGGNENKSKSVPVSAFQSLCLLLQCL